MAWIDVFSLIATISIFGGIVYGIVVITKTIKQSVASTKESLKTKGFDVSASGMSIKTSKRFNREDYLDASQRGLVQAVQAASFRRGASAQPSTNSPAIERVTSSSSTISTSSEERKKRSLLRYRHK